MSIDEVTDIGFTGTRDGISPRQIDLMILFLGSLQYSLIKKQRVNSEIEFHHGMCVGSDEGFHHLVRSILSGAVIIGHPPVDRKSMMVDTIHNQVDISRKPKEYLIRNKDIVDQSRMMIATPSGPEIQRSGTWSTIRYSRKTRTRLSILE